MHENELSEEMHRLMYTLRPKPGEGDGNLSMGEITLLIALKHNRHEHPEGLNPSKLSELLGISRPAITPLLTSLEEKGYVERAFDPEDRRQILIRALHKHGPEHDKQKGKFRAVLEVLDETEKENLLAILRKLNQNLQDKNPL